MQDGFPTAMKKKFDDYNKWGDPHRFDHLSQAERTLR